MQQEVMLSLEVENHRGMGSNQKKIPANSTINGIILKAKKDSKWSYDYKISYCEKPTKAEIDDYYKFLKQKELKKVDDISEGIKVFTKKKGVQNLKNQQTTSLKKRLPLIF